MSGSIHIQQLQPILDGIEERYANGATIEGNLFDTERASAGLEFHPIICGYVHDLYAEEGQGLVGCPHLSSADKEKAEVLGVSKGSKLQPSTAPAPSELNPTQVTSTAAGDDGTSISPNAPQDEEASAELLVEDDFDTSNASSTSPVSTKNTAKRK